MMDQHVSDHSLSTAAVELADDIRDIRPPVSYPVNSLFLAIALVLSAGLLWLIQRRRTPKVGVVPAEPPKPAWVAAREALRLLQAKDYPMKGMAREYYFELSYILRRYIEGRFALKAPEMTTEEFLDSLRRSDSLRASHKEDLQNFLTACDMVKFAKYRADAGEMGKGLALVEKFIDETVMKDEAMPV